MKNRARELERSREYYRKTRTKKLEQYRKKKERETEIEREKRLARGKEYYKRTRTRKLEAYRKKKKEKETLEENKREMFNLMADIEWYNNFYSQKFQKLLGPTT